MSVGLPPPFGPDWKVWARQLSAYLARTASTLRGYTADASPSQNGILLWDNVNGYPVVSKNNEWRQMVLEDGHFAGTITSDVTAALVDTAYPLTFTASLSDGITNGTPASRIVFEEGGHYMVSFSGQISSTSASTVLFRFWPRINGVDQTGSTIVAALHRNNATTVVSRATTFTVSAGDYLEAAWAVDNTSGFLDAVAATAYAPAAPAATIGITRLHG